MERTYDIFEIFPDGLLEWLEFVSGHEAALARAQALAAASPNEFRVMHLPTNSIVAVFNSRGSASESGSDERMRKRGGSGRAEMRLRQARRFGLGSARVCADSRRSRIRRSV